MRKDDYYLHEHGTKPNCVIDLYTSLRAVRSAAIKGEWIMKVTEPEPGLHRLHISPLYNKNEVYREVISSIQKALEDPPPSKR